MSLREHFFMISGRTDLRTGVSGAKFNAEADFEFRLPLAAPKPRKNSEQRIFWSNFCAEIFWGASENETSGIVWNEFWPSFVPIRAMFEG